MKLHHHIYEKCVTQHNGAWFGMHVAKGSVVRSIYLFWWLSAQAVSFFNSHTLYMWHLRHIHYTAFTTIGMWNSFLCWMHRTSWNSYEVAFYHLRIGNWSRHLCIHGCPGDQNITIFESTIEFWISLLSASL
jgi:hypothetical protein